MTPNERAAVNRSAAASLKIGTITALSATYALIYKDDPEWQQASEYFRATHWLLKLPGGEWLAVPKPYEIATFFNFGERLALGVADDDPTWAETWVRSWAYTMAIPMEPTGLMTPAESLFNYDTFRQRPIVPEWQLGLEPWQQFDSYTSEFSKALGKAINMSPAKIDHLLVGFTGSWGRDLLTVSNLTDPVRRSEAIYDWPITGRFVKNLARGSDATDKFYGLVSQTTGRLERRQNTYAELLRRGQDLQAEQYYADLSDQERVWVAANASETADEKRVHPLRRASDILSVYSGVRRDLFNNNLVSVVTDQKLTINASHVTMIADQLTRAGAAEARNAMIVIGERGWAQREIMDTEPYLETIRMIDPAIADEIEYRLQKQRVLPFDGVRSVWSSYRDRLLKEGPGAYTGDLRAQAAMGGGGGAARPLPAPQPLTLTPSQ